MQGHVPYLNRQYIKNVSTSAPFIEGDCSAILTMGSMMTDDVR